MLTTFNLTGYLNHLQAALTAWCPALMTHKVLFGAPLPVDLLAAAVWLVLLSPLAGLAWLRRRRRVFPVRAVAAPPPPHTVWPPPPSISASSIPAFGVVGPGTEEP